MILSLVLVPVTLAEGDPEWIPDSSKRYARPVRKWLVDPAASRPILLPTSAYRATFLPGEG
jgi:hypothetical protein